MKLEPHGNCVHMDADPRLVWCPVCERAPQPVVETIRSSDSVFHVIRYGYDRLPFLTPVQVQALVVQLQESLQQRTSGHAPSALPHVECPYRPPPAL